LNPIFAYVMYCMIPTVIRFFMCTVYSYSISPLHNIEWSLFTIQYLYHQH